MRRLPTALTSALPTACAAVAVVALAVAGSGCRRESSAIKAAPEKERPRSTPPPPSPALPVVDTLIGFAGEEVVLEGRAATRASSHMKANPPGKEAFFVLPKGREFDVAAYVADLPKCDPSTTILLTGKVFVAVGKLHGGDYAEPQLDVRSWTCR
jgi:hypothetical protein